MSVIAGPVAPFFGRRLIRVVVHSIRVLPFLWTAVAGAAAAQTPLTLAEAERLALESEPGMTAAMSKAAALRAQGTAAGELPDPKLRLGLNNFPFESGGFATEGMTNVGVSVRQDIPRGRTLELRSRLFELAADEMAVSADKRGRDVLTSVRSSWLEVFYWERAGRLVEETRPYFDDLATITRSLYSVGRRNQQDVLRADLELSRLDNRLLEIERRRLAARAALREWVGAAADRPLPVSLHSLPSPPPLETLRAALDRHPVFLAFDAAIEAREAGVALAKQRAKPGWSVDLGYSYRDGALPDGSPRSDFVSLNVTVDLPFFSRDSLDGTLAAALGERAAVRSTREQSLREFRSRLDIEYAHWQQLSHRVALYDERIVKQTEEHARAALLAYQNDRSDFGDVMRAYIDNLNTRIDAVRLQVDRAQSHAVLANLGGFPR
jgi:outer membrane protein TolC